MDSAAQPPPVLPHTSVPIASPLDWDGVIAAVQPPTVLVAIAGHMGADLRRRTPPEDVWQETLLRAWQARGRFVWRDLPSFRQWLLRIARNVIADLVDHEAALKRGGGCEPLAFSTLSAAAGGSEGLATSIYAGPVVSTTPSRVAADREQAAAMEGALAALPEELREVVRLRLFEGLTSEAVAKVLQLGVSAVWHRFHKGAELYYRRLRASGKLQEG